MYREVTMIEVREVLRFRGEGLPKKRIAAQLGLDPKTVRRYLTAAQDAGVRVTATITDEEVRQVLLALHPTGGRPRGDGWSRCLEHRAPIARWLGDGLRLTKIRKLLVRQGIEIAYPTLHRFAVLELQFGKTATTIPVLDGEPGQELQLDTGWVGWLTLTERKRRRFRAWIFTAVRSRHRFVYPTFEETTARAIEACDAAWDFFGGVFKVIIPDNTKAIIIDADRWRRASRRRFSNTRRRATFTSIPRACGMPATKGASSGPSRRPRRLLCRRSLTTLDAARAWGRHWCLNDYGLRRHSRTQRRPSSTFRPKSTRSCCRRPPRPMTFPCGVSRKSGAISSRPSTRRSTRFRIRMSGSASPRAPTRRSSASTRAVC